MVATTVSVPFKGAVTEGSVALDSFFPFQIRFSVAQTRTPATLLVLLSLVT